MTRRYRSGFENNFATFLELNNVKYDYESRKIRYTPKIRTYTPDFHLLDYDMFIETKGHFVTSDRSKHLLIQEQHPDIDIRFVFQNAKKKLYKGAKTTYADWCDKHGFQYAQEELPRSWFRKG
tara:strand:- start:385 stop:753 length:369 start_codon:yes stop_codon:yes gene_type:complete